MSRCWLRTRPNTGEGIRRANEGAQQAALLYAHNSSTTTTKQPAAATANDGNDTDNPAVLASECARNYFYFLAGRLLLRRKVISGQVPNFSNSKIF